MTRSLAVTIDHYTISYTISCTIVYDIVYDIVTRSLDIATDIIPYIVYDIVPTGRGDFYLPWTETQQMLSREVSKL